MEKILESLRYLKENADDSVDLIRLEWCIETVSNTDKLYQPLFEGGDAEAQNWLKNYSEKVTRQTRRRVILARKSKILESEHFLECKKHKHQF